MKTIVASLVLVIVLCLSTEGKATRVKGFIKRSSGTYVMPYHRTKANTTKIDNWSTKGNVNPYTGKNGTKEPFGLRPYKRYRLE